MHLCAGATRSNDNSSPCSSAEDNVYIQFPTHMTTFEDLLSEDISQNTTPPAAATMNNMGVDEPSK